MKGSLKDLPALQFSPSVCARELQQFRNLLDQNAELSERAQILPFFKKHKHLSALIGACNPYVGRFDCLAYEYDLFGDFACDLVVGDRNQRAFTLLEFEDAKRNSLFCKGLKSTQEWGRRYEHGFSQLVDWFCCIADQQSTDKFLNHFGGRDVRFVGWLVLGRSSFLGDRERRRLNWRSSKVLVDSNAVTCMTFDDLYQLLRDKLTSLEQAARPEQQKRSQPGSASAGDDQGDSRRRRRKRKEATL